MVSTLFLLEDNYVTKIKNTIQETKSEYANNPSVSPAPLWEMTKLKVREASLSYAKQKKKERSDQADEIGKTTRRVAWSFFQVRTSTYDLET